MNQKILVLLDGSELAEKVLPYVESLARSMDAHVILFRVPIYAYERASVTALAGHMPVPFPEDREEALRDATNYLEEVRQDLASRGVRVTTAIEEGPNTAETIIEYATDKNVDMIAMSTHGRSGLGRLIYGSVADEVLRRSHKPVLLIRPLEAPAS
jgi:nucleotide-binding universal stress UspA family protein